MEHRLYFDGDTDEIAWCLEGNSGSCQVRKHAGIYLGRVADEQSRYIALHVGIFWCIGTLRIKNSDAVRVMITSKTMFDHLGRGRPPADPFIATRTAFIDQLVRQRGLKVSYHLTPSCPATALLRDIRLHSDQGTPATQPAQSSRAT